MKLEFLQKEFQLSEEQIKKFSIFASLLKEWNEKMNLTAIVEDEEIVEKHFYDSLLPYKLFNFNGKKLADLGTGPGFPGLAIAIACPECNVTLCDATKKKFLFLEEVVKQTGLTNVRYYQGRVEDMGDMKESFDVVTSRGFSSLPIFLEVGLPLLKRGGTLLAYKGEKGHEELKDSTKALNVLGGKVYEIQEDILPDSQFKRINVFIKKINESPDKYPRNWAKIVSKPL